jgi:hypothetical protein
MPQRRSISVYRRSRFDEPKKIGWDRFIVLFGTKKGYFRGGQFLYVAEVVWISQKRSVGIDL